MSDAVGSSNVDKMIADAIEAERAQIIESQNLRYAAKGYVPQSEVVKFIREAARREREEILKIVTDSIVSEDGNIFNATHNLALRGIIRAIRARSGEESYE